MAKQAPGIFRITPTQCQNDAHMFYPDTDRCTCDKFSVTAIGRRPVTNQRAIYTVDGSVEYETMVPIPSAPARPDGPIEWEYIDDPDVPEDDQ